MYRQLLRNPAGQKMTLENNLYRIWLFGDVTGDEMVNSADYASLRSYLLKRVTTLGAQNWLFSADLTGDGLINAADYSILQANLLRKPIAYPVFPADSNYKDYYTQGTGNVTVNDIKCNSITWNVTGTAGNKLYVYDSSGEECFNYTLTSSSQSFTSTPLCPLTEYHAVLYNSNWNELARV